MSESPDTETVARRAGIVAVFTLISRVLGYARDAFLAATFGASGAYDAFIVAQTIPNFLRRLVAEGALVVAIVPIIAEVKQADGREGARRFLSAFLGVFVPFLLLLVALGMIFPASIVEVFAPGFDPSRHALAESLVQVMMPYIFFISLTALAGGVLNVEGRFAPWAAAPILLNVATIAIAVFAADRFSHPIIAVGVGVTVGGVLQLLLQFPFLAQERYLVAPRFEPRHPAVVLLARRMLPALFGVAVYQINLMLIRQIGSFLPEGQLSCYYNATRLQEFALGVFAVSVSVAALPTLSEHAAKKDFKKLAETSTRALLATNFVTIPASLGLLVLAEPIVGVLFRHGRFTAEDAKLTAEILVVLGAGTVPIGIARVLVPVFYALGETRTPVIAAAASLAVLFAVGHALRDSYQIVGLTMAVTFSAVAQVIVLRLALGRALRSRGTTVVPGTIRHFLRAAIAFIPGGIALYFGAKQLPWFSGSVAVRATALVGLVGVGAGSYGGFGYLLGIEEVRLAAAAVRRRLARFL